MVTANKQGAHTSADSQSQLLFNIFSALHFLFPNFLPCDANSIMFLVKF